MRASESARSLFERDGDNVRFTGTVTRKDVPHLLTVTVISNVKFTYTNAHILPTLGNTTLSDLYTLIVINDFHSTIRLEGPINCVRR